MLELCSLVAVNIASVDDIAGRPMIQDQAAVSCGLLLFSNAAVESVVMERVSLMSRVQIVREPRRGGGCLEGKGPANHRRADGHASMSSHFGMRKVAGLRWGTDEQTLFARGDRPS